MRLLHLLIRLPGWSPVGKTVVLGVDNASEATINNRQFAGKLVALNQDGSAVIELEAPFELGVDSAIRLA